MYRLEVIAFTIDSCTIIEQSGAHRIELCANPDEGGTTPSYGMIKTAREKVSIELFPIIRPRGGDFLYNEEEFTVMMHDVQFCKEIGCDGVVVGLLEANGVVDKKRTATLVNAAYPLDVTFHRAFDRVADAEQALEDVIECGCTRILTSGLRPTATEGKETLNRLVTQAAGRITIMPGSGIRSSNIEEMIKATGAVEFHTSARKLNPSAMQFVQPAMQESLLYASVDENEVKAIIKALPVS